VLRLFERILRAGFPFLHPPHGLIISLKIHQTALKPVFREGCMSIIGKTLENFEITSQLGRGGMEEVYRVKA
jgi:hypothetical protein